MSLCPLCNCESADGDPTLAVCAKCSRPAYTPGQCISTDLCPGCDRDWSRVKRGSESSALCLACERYRQRHPDVSWAAARHLRHLDWVSMPRYVAPNGSEWRALGSCVEAPAELFDWQEPRRGLRAQLRLTAQTFCFNCPVLQSCRAESEANPLGSIGLFGAIYRSSRRDKLDFLTEGIVEAAA
jgi:hypothetical protein